MFFGWVYHREEEVGHLLNKLNSMQIICSKDRWINSSSKLVFSSGSLLFVLFLARKGDLGLSQMQNRYLWSLPMQFKKVHDGMTLVNLYILHKPNVLICTIARILGIYCILLHLRLLNWDPDSPQAHLQAAQLKVYYSHLPAVRACEVNFIEKLRKKAPKFELLWLIFYVR